jgi:hypothetical protein
LTGLTRQSIALKRFVFPMYAQVRPAPDDLQVAAAGMNRLRSGVAGKAVMA